MFVLTLTIVHLEADKDLLYVEPGGGTAWKQG